MTINPELVTATDLDELSDRLELPTNSQFEYQYDKQGNQKLWCTESTADSGCQGNGARRIVHETYFPSGDLEQRKAQDDPTATARTYDYSYNDNGSLIKEIDNKLNRTTSFTYDDAERNTRVNDKWQNGSDSLLAYDLDGNVTQRQTDGHFDSQNPDQYDGGKKTTFKYDQLDRETQAIVEPSNDDPAHTTDTSYFPSGQRDSQTTHNGTSSDGATRFSQKWFYGDDGLLSRMQRSDASGSSTKDQVYSYDVDGNRTKDERGSYGFNARDQLTHWSGTHQDVSYALNGAGAVTQKTVTPESTGMPQTTVFSYMPGTDVLTKATSGGQDWFYCYSSSADLTRIAQKSCDQTDQGDPQADYYNYDAFDRLASAKGPDDQAGAGSNPRGYQYDGLDRPYSECVGNSTTTSFQDVQDPSCPSGNKKTDSYVGMSPLLSQQQDQAAGTTQSFDYDSSFNRLGQQTDGGTQAGYQSYAQSADGSVEGLIGNSGQSTGSYFYDPYGQLQQTDGSVPAPNQKPESQLSPDAQANNFRFQDFYGDSGIQTYDMQARQYRPDVGRFLTQDTYESSLGQSNLESDPLTQDTYAFAGGNPVNDIEFDGHGGAGGGWNATAAPSHPLSGASKRSFDRANKAQGQQAQQTVRARDEGRSGGSQYQANQQFASALAQESYLSNYHAKPTPPRPGCATTTMLGGPTMAGVACREDSTGGGILSTLSTLVGGIGDDFSAMGTSRALPQTNWGVDPNLVNAGRHPGATAHALLKYYSGT